TINLDIDRDKVRAYGLTVAQVYQQIAAKLTTTTTAETPVIGNVEIALAAPYPISYRAITPKRDEVGNLLVPVCLSASHIAYGSIRMEPVFMVLSQSAAIAACLAIDRHDGCVQDVDAATVLERLLRDPFADGSLPDIFVDNCDASSVVVNGEWETSRIHGGRTVPIIFRTDRPARFRNRCATYRRS
ncbi:xanthan lyase, partial [human gut metagenome]